LVLWKKKKTGIEESSIFGSLENIKELAKNRRFLEFLISFEKTVATFLKTGYLRILRTGG